jgi:hypothetical protein
MVFYLCTNFLKLSRKFHFFLAVKMRLNIEYDVFTTLKSNKIANKIELELFDSLEELWEKWNLNKNWIQPENQPQNSQAALKQLILTNTNLSMSTCMMPKMTSLSGRWNFIIIETINFRDEFFSKLYQLRE